MSQQITEELRRMKLSPRTKNRDSEDDQGLFSLGVRPSGRMNDYGLRNRLQRMETEVTWKGLANDDQVIVTSFVELEYYVFEWHNYQVLEPELLYRWFVIFLLYISWKRHFCPLSARQWVDWDAALTDPSSDKIQLHLQMTQDSDSTLFQQLLSSLPSPLRPRLQTRLHIPQQLFSTSLCKKGRLRPM